MSIGWAVTALLVWAGSVLLAYGAGMGTITGWDQNDERGQTPAAVGIILLCSSAVGLLLVLTGTLP